MRNKYKRRIRKNFVSPFKNTFSLLMRKEVVIEDFFRDNSLCLLGMRKPFEYYINNKFPENPYEDVVVLPIDREEHTNLGIIAGSGIGKTRVIKNIISSYYKAGWKILIFSPKEDEWSSAKSKGDGTRLHPKSENEKLPISSYCPSYIKHHLETEQFPTSKYKFYSHSISSFKNVEAFKSLGFTSNIAGFCVGQINQGVTNLEELKFAIINSDLPTISKSTALNKIDTLKQTKYFNDRLKPLDLKGEWEMNNIVALNYFSQEGYMLSSDVWRIIDQVRSTAQQYVRKNNKQKIMILFDDVNYYGDKKEYNEYSIKSIQNCQINYRSIGIDNITSYQYPEAVDPKIVKGSTKKLLSYVEQPSSLRGIIPADALYCLEVSEENGGIKVDKKNYITEWILREEGRDWFRFFPEDCRIGHN